MWERLYFKENSALLSLEQTLAARLNVQLFEASIVFHHSIDVFAVSVCVEVESKIVADLNWLVSKLKIFQELLCPLGDRIPLDILIGQLHLLLLLLGSQAESFIHSLKELSCTERVVHQDTSHSLVAPCKLATDHR